jgi:hypothetical protein
MWTDYRCENLESCDIRVYTRIILCDQKNGSRDFCFEGLWISLKSSKTNADHPDWDFSLFFCLVDIKLGYGSSFPHTNRSRVLEKLTVAQVAFYLIRIFIIVHKTLTLCFFTIDFYILPSMPRSHKCPRRCRFPNWRCLLNENCYVLTISLLITKKKLRSEIYRPSYQLVGEVSTNFCE